ncbi:pentatricopeptide repeat-containing protein [Hibiscus syriacus]|uniref:Pentatricopeptide repeat-containing protein n=1 Tax=Hibiscus syriacus TaxID=106335 RepID=A0A6A2WTX2_HIBSY|nr:pentatricopeptide repeat-containing protein [Hibiscus syriacus]
MSSLVLCSCCLSWWPRVATFVLALLHDSLTLWLEVATLMFKASAIRSLEGLVPTFVSLHAHLAWGRDKWYQSESLWARNDRFNSVLVEGANRKKGVSARKGKECHDGKREESPVGSRASSVSKHEDTVTSSQGMFEANIAHQGEPVLEVERLKGDAEGMSERDDTFSHVDEESLHEEQGYELTIDDKWAYLMEGLAFHTQRFIKLEEITTSWEQRVDRLEQDEYKAKQTQSVVESHLDRLESMEGRFKVETQRVLNELEMVEGEIPKNPGSGFEERGVMLGGEKGDAQRISEAIAVAGMPTELADIKPRSDVSFRPMPRNNGNNRGDREKDVPRSVALTIMERMREGEVARVGGGTSKSAKSRERLGLIYGINVAKQASRRGKAVDDEAVEPRRKPDAIVNDRSIKSGARLDEATCYKVAKSRGKHGETTSCQVVHPGSRRAETASVKAVEHRKGPGAIASDNAVKQRVQSEQVRSQYARMEVWSKLRRLRHKGTLKEYPWAQKVLERREVKVLSKALTIESIKEFGVKKNKTSKPKPRAEGSGKISRNEGKSKDEECCSSSGRESPLMMNQMVDLVMMCALVQVTQTLSQGRVEAKCRRHHPFQRWKASSNLRVRRDDVRKGIRLCHEKVPMHDGVGQDLMFSAGETKFGWDPRPCHKGHESPSRGKSRLVGKSSYERDALVGVLARFITWRQEPKRAQPLWEAESLWGDVSKWRCRKATKIDVKYGARDREVTCDKSQGKQSLSAATRASLSSVGESVTGYELGSETLVQVSDRELSGLSKPPDLAHHLENAVEPVHISRAEKESGIISEDDQRSSVNMARGNKIRKLLWENLTISGLATFVLAFPHNSLTLWLGVATLVFKASAIRSLEGLVPTFVSLHTHLAWTSKLDIDLDASDFTASVPLKKVPNGDVFEASRSGDADRLRYLLEFGVNVNARDNWDSVALYYACLAGHLDAARMLLENGAICSENTFDGDRCHYAALNLKVRELLKAFEARPPPLGPLQDALRDTFLSCEASRGFIDQATESGLHFEVSVVKCGLTDLSCIDERGFAIFFRVDKGQRANMRDGKRVSKMETALGLNVFWKKRWGGNKRKEGAAIM